jgi:23S rRNA (guanosine2251-2'-O)-methyltransferase
MTASQKNTRAIQFFEETTYAPVPKDTAPIIVAVNLKTPENIGHLMRLAANSGCKKLWIVQEDTTIRNTKLKRVAGLAYEKVDWAFCTAVELEQLLPSNYIQTALETAPGSENLFTCQLPDAMALMVGNEQEGLPEWALEKCTRSVHIPMTGPVKSMNVSHAAAVCLFEWMRQNYFVK